jgi:hypothetical protein
MWTHTQNYASHWSLIEHLDLLEQTTILIAVFKKSLPPSCNSANSRKHFDFLPWHLVAVIIYVNLNWMTVSDRWTHQSEISCSAWKPNFLCRPTVHIILLNDIHSLMSCIYPEFSTCLIIYLKKFIDLAMTCRETWKWYLLSTWTRWSKPKKGSLRYTALEKGILWLKEG